MAGRSHWLMRRLAHLALAVVLLAPLAAGAHVHGFGTDASPACSVCTVAKHAPAVVAPSAPSAALHYHALTAIAPPLVSSRTGECRRPAGRAPPQTLPRQAT